MTESQLAQRGQAREPRSQHDAGGHCTGNHTIQTLSPFPLCQRDQGIEMGGEPESHVPALFQIQVIFLNFNFKVYYRLHLRG